MRMPVMSKLMRRTAMVAGGVCVGAIFASLYGASHSETSSGISASPATAFSAPKAAHHSSLVSTGKSVKRLVQEQASLTEQVSHVRAVGSRVFADIAHLQGFVASTQLMSYSGGRYQMMMTLRVPQSDFSQVMTQLQTLGKDKAFSQSGVDVTHQYQSLGLQIMTLQDEARAYQSLFAKATSMKTMLQIQQALAGVQANLQSLQQQQSTLARSVRLATISLTLLPFVAPAPRVHMGFGQAFAHSWRSMQQALAQAVVLLGWIVPWLILLGVVGFSSRYFIRLWLRLHKQKGV